MCQCWQRVGFGPLPASIFTNKPTFFPSKKKKARQDSKGPAQGNERANLMRNYKLRPGHNSQCWEAMQCQCETKRGADSQTIQEIKDRFELFQGRAGV